MSKKSMWLAKLEGAEFRVHLMLNECATAVNSVTDNPMAIEQYLRPLIASSVRYNPDSENFGIVCLSSRRKPIGMTIVSNGVLDAVLVTPMAVFRPAILMNASAIVVFHNHPSGDPSPSDTDVKVTRDLIRAGQLLKIDVMDHIILGTPGNPTPESKGYASLRELGYFYS